MRGGAVLQNAARVDAVVFDKTGTLTEGKPRMTDVVTAPGATDEELLSVALAVEEHSDHPLASAIVAGARARLGEQARRLTASDLRSITGRGVEARVDGETVHIGKPVLFTELPGADMPAIRKVAKALIARVRTADDASMRPLVAQGYPPRTYARGSAESPVRTLLSPGGSPRPTRPTAPRV